MRVRLWTAAVVLLASALLVPDVHAEPRRFAGRRVDEALGDLRTRGLRIVYSTELVRPEMRVRAEPRATSPPDQLAEILAPHGLAAETGPGGLIQIVRRRSPAPARAPRANDEARRAAVEAGTPRAAADAVYLEQLTVTGQSRATDGVAGGIARELSRQEVSALAGRIGDDPTRAVQALPGVAASDDFSSAFSVRGSPYRHAGIVVDDVVAPWLQHAATGRRDTGTLAMLPSDAIDGALLQVGPYARLDGGQLGPQLRLTVREGSRAARQLHASASATTSALVGEGPLGRVGRGSWMAAVRRSHVEWPVGRQDEDTTIFGFTDIQTKFVYDVRPTQQLAVSIVGGLSQIEREAADALSFGDGRNRAGLATVAWRSVLAPRAVVTQRLSMVAHDVYNNDWNGQPLGWGRDSALAYRIDVLRAVAGGVLESGGQVRRLGGARHGQWWGNGWLARESLTGGTRATWHERSGYATFTTTPRAGATFGGGVRLADSSLVDRAALDRWIHAGWPAGRGWRLHAGVATVHQFPVLEHLDGPDARTLVPARATQAELGVSTRSRAGFQWNATVFVRRERDTLREPVALAPTGLTPADGLFQPLVANTLSGSAHGFELAVARRAESGLTGSIGYAYGVARYDDPGRGETFDADFDQRHALNVTGSVPLKWMSRVDVTFRTGTNFPIPGYLAQRDGRLFAGDQRNRLRLPAYARLDLRVEHALRRGDRRVVLFLETLNVLDRANLGLGEGRVVAGTGEAIGVTERLFPRTFGGGIRVSLAPAWAR